MDARADRLVKFYSLRAAALVAARGASEALDEIHSDPEWIDLELSTTPRERQLALSIACQRCTPPLDLDHPALDHWVRSLEDAAASEGWVLPDA